MIYVPYNVLKTIHEETHSAMPDAPVRPWVPKRHPIRDAVRRWRERRTPEPATTAATTARGHQVATRSTGPTAARTASVVALKPVANNVCEAEARDRGSAPEGVACAS
ncbi:hypothetical protein [Kribbella sp. NPDC048915]|uniref:hypothetical protein n=1 Tax=Kribbella sp. NPDC048915 TaxID=3155148 RepID=UPI0033E7E30B